MKKCRAAALLLTVLFLLCACTGSPRQESTPITITLKAPFQEMNCISDPEVTNVQMFLERAGAAYETATGGRVKINVRMFALTDENKAVTDTFDTPDAPDVLYESYFNMAGYVHTGRVVPLDDMISDNLRNDIDEAFWTMSRAGGKTYMMPYLDMQNILIYNKDHFRTCGLEAYCGTGTEIQSWTMDEWTEILDTLAARLPEEVHPLAMYARNNQGDTHIMSYLRAFGSGIFDDSGNFDFESAETVRALTWLQSGVSRGWYPPHPENLEMKDCSEMFSNRQLTLYNFNGSNPSLYDALDNYGFVNYPGNVATSFINGFMVFDNGDPEKIQAAKDFIRFIYETEALRDLSAGTLPVCRSVADKYASQITMLSDFTENNVHVVDFMNNSPNWQGTDSSVRSVFYPHIAALLSGQVTPEECAAGLNGDCNRALEIGRAKSTLHE